MGITPLLFVIDYFKSPHAGTEGQLYALIEGLDRAEFSPHLLVFSDSPWLRQHKFPCEYTILGHRSISSAATWLALARSARKFRGQGFRLAHVFFNDPSVICPPVFRIFGIRTLLSRRDMGYWYTPVLKRILRITGRLADGVVVNSKAVKRVTVDSEGFAEKDVHVIYNGYLDSKNTESSQNPMISELRRLRESGCLLMGVVANIRSIKRIGDAVSCLASLRDRVPVLNLVVIGDGDGTQLECQAHAGGVVDRVHLMGVNHDVQRCLLHLDIGILCSESEGFSNAIIEYKYAGLPVVCSDGGGNSEAVTHGEDGFVYPVGDTELLSSAIQALAEDAMLRARMGALGRERAERQFSMAAMVESHQSLYREVLARNSAWAANGEAEERIG